MAVMSGVSSSEKAYRNILEAILDNRLQVGVFLSQRRLADIGGTSIISAREALKQLQHEYYLEHVPRWGYRIPLETRNLIMERYALREAIETMVAYILASMSDKPFAGELHRRAEECDLIKTDDADSIALFARKHRELHLYMAECTGNQLLYRELERLGLRSLLNQSAKVTWAQEVDNWENWHRNLIDEILSGDASRAQEAVHKHIQHGLYHDLKKFDESFKANHEAGSS
jgi:DNA-binding GntR family transcriptional regulator